jgi:hypothetical protein
MNEYEQIRADLRSVDKFPLNFDAAYDAPARADATRRQSADRSFIVYAVICLYVSSIGLALLYLFILGVWYREEVFHDMAEIVKVAILPVLTLVIGYYFGTK